MAPVEPRRISGTYWERLLLIAVPIPVIAMLAISLKGNSVFSDISIEGCLIVIIIILLVWIIDCEPARRYHPVAFIDGDIISIGSDTILPSSIQSITPLSRFRPPTTQLLEIVYGTGANAKTSYILSKPDIAPFGLFAFQPKTLRLLGRSHPELRNRVQPERKI